MANVTHILYKLLAKACTRERGKEHIKHKGYKEFYTREEAQTWGKKHFGSIADLPELTAFEDGIATDSEKRHSLDYYLGHYHVDINQMLRKSSMLNIVSQRRKERINKIAADVEEILENFEIPENIILYRSIVEVKHLHEICIVDNYANKEMARKNIVGKWLVYPCFVSTSLCYASLKESFASDVYLRIRCNKGHNGAYINTISKRSDEQEVLLPPNQALFVEKCYINKDGATIYECTLGDCARDLYNIMFERAKKNILLIY